MSNKKRIEDFYVRASGQVLTENLPNHWDALTDDRLDYWLEKHAWEPYEYWSAKQLWEQITSVAYLLLDVHNEAMESNDE